MWDYQLRGRCIHKIQLISFQHRKGVQRNTVFNSAGTKYSCHSTTSTITSGIPSSTLVTESFRFQKSGRMNTDQFPCKWKQKFSHCNGCSHNNTNDAMQVSSTTLSRGCTQSNATRAWRGRCQLVHQRSLAALLRLPTLKHFVSCRRSCWATLRWKWPKNTRHYWHVWHKDLWQYRRALQTAGNFRSIGQSTRIPESCFRPATVWWDGTFEYNKVRLAD